MQRVFDLMPALCFNGHTHVPGLWIQEGPEAWTFIAPEDCRDGFRLDGRKLICNVGAVGQPRDGDPRACYVLCDGERLWFRRVRYDVETTRRKIHANPQLADYLGDRLREGR
ncbi:MAG: metallophosphoesterase family protein [Gemmataceae bacterium]